MGIIIFLFILPILVIIFLPIMAVFIGLPLMGICKLGKEANNTVKLKEMDKIIDEFRAITFPSEKEKDDAKYQLKLNLLKLKNNITNDKKGMAQDKINIL